MMTRFSSLSVSEPAATASSHQCRLISRFGNMLESLFDIALKVVDSDIDYLEELELKGRPYTKCLLEEW
jgi:hypothetical protein